MYVRRWNIYPQSARVRDFSNVSAKRLTGLYIFVENYRVDSPDVSPTGNSEWYPVTADYSARLKRSAQNRNA